MILLVKSAPRGSHPLPGEALTTEILRGGELPVRRFDPKSAAPFVNKSVSEATRRAYSRALRRNQFVDSSDPRA